MENNFFVDVISTLIYVVCILFVISALDDLSTDLLFIFFKIFNKDDWSITLEELNSKPEKRIALFVPAWHEEAVITEMVTHNLANIDYASYDFYIGVYPNDPGTLKKATRLERRFPRVYKSVVPHPGPTNKADCLNWIYQRMKLTEENEKKTYEIIIMHDSEDIIHPLSFKLVNYLMPEYQMVQVPVFSLEVPWNYFTAGTYCDEFSEHHIKNLAVREKVNGFIPSAGVGTAFARTALDTIAEKKDNLIFNTDSLTEDYEIGLKFSQYKFKQIIARRALKVERKLKIFKYLPPIFREVFGYKYLFIATREYFPDQFKAAVKQKSRWILGIIFQGWEQIRWNARGINKLFLYIDRKGVYSNFASFVATLLSIFGIIYMIIYHIFDLRYGLERFFPSSGFIWYLIIFNTMVMCERIGIKYYTSATLYGAKFAFTAILRIPWLNVVNFFAMSRAFYRYCYHKITHKRMTWDKTTHTFPGRDAMKVYRKRLGELLLENRVISDADLQQALSQQEKESLRLGEILVRMDLINEQDLAQLLSHQYELKMAGVEDFDPLLAERMPGDVLRLYEAIPLKLEENTLHLGVRSPLDEEILENIETLIGLKIQQRIITNSDYYTLKERIKVPVKLGIHLAMKGLLKPDDFLEALAEQRESHLPLGDILIKNNYISPQQLSSEFKLLFDMELLLDPEKYTEITPLDLDSQGEQAFILKDLSGNHILASPKIIPPQLENQILKQYNITDSKLLLKKDVRKWHEKEQRVA